VIVFHGVFLYLNVGVNMVKLFKSAADRLLEEQIYEAVALEISKGKVKPGLWAKALSQTNGNEKLTQSVYIKLRVQNIKDEDEVQNDIEREMDRRAAEREAQEAAARWEATRAEREAEELEKEKAEAARQEANDNPKEGMAVLIIIFIIVIFFLFIALAVN
jgi:hypothetical protein